MSALASLERFGEEDPSFINWRHYLQSEQPLVNYQNMQQVKNKTNLLNQEFLEGTAGSLRKKISKTTFFVNNNIYLGTDL